MRIGIIQPLPLEVHDVLIALPQIFLPGRALIKNDARYNGCQDDTSKRSMANSIIIVGSRNQSDITVRTSTVNITTPKTC